MACSQAFAWCKKKVMRILCAACRLTASHKSNIDKSIVCVNETISMWCKIILLLFIAFVDEKPISSPPLFSSEKPQIVKWFSRNLDLIKIDFDYPFSSRTGTMATDGNSGRSLAANQYRRFRRDKSETNRTNCPSQCADIAPDQRSASARNTIP